MMPVNARPLSPEVRHQEHHYHCLRVPHVHRAHRVSQPGSSAFLKQGMQSCRLHWHYRVLPAFVLSVHALCSIFESGLVESFQSPDGSF